MATVIKLKTGTSVPTTSDITAREVAIDTSAQKFYINDSGTIKEIGGDSVDLSAVDQDVIPDTNDLRSLGSSSRRWKKIWLAAATVDLGGATISSDGSGTIEIAASGATLPENSKDAGGNPIAVTGTGTGTGGVTISKVPFFTRSGGLSTKNTDFEFNATVDNNKPFLDQSTFVLANGSGLSSDDEITVFQL